MPGDVKIGWVFAPDKCGERYVCHYVEHDHGQSGDGAEETKDLAGTEEDAYNHETYNLEDLLYMNGIVRQERIALNNQDTPEAKTHHH